MELTDKEKITVFYNDTAIHLLLRIQHQEESNALFIRSQSDLHRFLDRFFKADVKEDAFLKSNNADELIMNFRSYFKLVRAAGGMVENNKTEFLLIKRFGIWDLPKGKLEKNENMETCALREVREETGVSTLKINGPLPSTFHIYFRDEKYVLKETVWFQMHTDFSGELKPQIGEDITEAVWMSRIEAEKALFQSYRSIRDTLVPALEI
jgi:8-oxo-dGTP pyrophosphatase MutT (NUDIX family)